MQTRPAKAHKSLILAARLRNLSPIVDFLKRDPERTLIILEDTTDDLRSDPYNSEALERSVAFVREFFIRNGISADRITSRPAAGSDPVAPNNAADARRQQVMVTSLETSRISENRGTPISPEQIDQL